MNAKTGDEKQNQLSMIEQSLQSMLVQKQGFQTQLMELENALKELKTAKTSYKMISSIMVKMNPEELKKDLDSKVDILQLRVKTIEKQESKLREKADVLQSEVLKNIEK